MSDSIAILSLLAVFVTLVINAIQTQTQVKQARLLTESNAVLLYQHMTEGMRDLSEIFVQYPKLRPSCRMRRCRSTKWSANEPSLWQKFLSTLWASHLIAASS